MSILSYATGIQHIGLPTGDLQKTLDFYTDMGFDIAWRSENGRVAFLKYQTIVIETYYSPEAAEKPGAIEHLCLDVSDIEGAFAVARQKGYEICPPGEIKGLPFWNNGVKFFTIMGPNAEKIEFCQIL